MLVQNRELAAPLAFTYNNAKHMDGLLHSIYPYFIQFKLVYADSFIFGKFNIHAKNEKWG